MNNSTISLSLSPDSAAASDSVTMEQKGVEEFSTLSNYDILQMMTLAQYGISAKTYLMPDCPVSITDSEVSTWLDFYVWPSRIDLEYSLTTQNGTIGEKSVVDIDKELDIIFEMSDRVELPWNVTIESLEYQSPCYGQDGVRMATPKLTVVDNVIMAPCVMFAVLRLKGVAHGYRYTNMISVEKQPETKVTDLESDVTVTWGADEKEVLALEIPGCVAAYLASCPGGGTSINDTCDKTEKDQVTVYFSTCDGSTLGIQRTDPCKNSVQIDG